MYPYHTDENGYTHIKWTLNGITAQMMDWHWSNLDKTYSLWHPVDHEGFCWAVPVTPERFLGAVHKTLQGERAKIYSDPQLSPMGLEYYDVALLPPELARLVTFDHAVLVAPVKAENIGKPQQLNNALSFRLHQWSMCEEGICGMTSAITPNPADPEEERRRTEAWIPHAMGEIAYWEDFLPQLYKLWQAVKHEKLNPIHNLTVEHLPSGQVRYLHL